MNRPTASDPDPPAVPATALSPDEPHAEMADMSATRDNRIRWSSSTYSIGNWKVWCCCSRYVNDPSS
jgi:hypothetical protein